MSLLDTGPETLTVRPPTRDTDPDGNLRWRGWRDGDPEFTITGVQVEPVESNGIAVDGQRITRSVRAYFRRLPLGLDADRISGEFTEVIWDGLTWDSDGSPNQYRRGFGTRHITMLLNQRR